MKRRWCKCQHYYLRYIELVMESYGIHDGPVISTVQLVGSHVKSATEDDARASQRDDDRCDVPIAALGVKRSNHTDEKQGST